jgi:lipopolysaccharide/colanic/teichoic acid biosynthesis glycosyltransferase
MNAPQLWHLPHPTPAPVLVVTSRVTPGREKEHSSHEPDVFNWSPAPYPFYQAVVKRAFDAICAISALLLLWPLFLIIALMIRLDSPGPVIYRQQRIGKNGVPFTMYKFRSMRWDPIHNVRFFIRPDGTTVHKLHDDPRLTHVGAWLRRTSIDELPQLINIAKGDMSVIGPRPELIEIVRTYEPWQHRRHVVKPGLTGWWQVCGRDDLPMNENTELDLYYVNHLSPVLDLRILLRTVGIVATGCGAF